ncbi:MAG: N-acetylmuramoyl-L-alanine amidase [Elusimicrobiota bacterium]
MKRHLLLTLAALWLFVPAFAGADEVEVVLSGKYQDPIEAYKVGSSYYLNAKQAGGVFGGQVYWYPVSGRVQMSFRGRQLQLLVGSREATGAGKPFKLDSGVLLRSGQAFIPLGFFLSEEFSELSGMESEFNERTKLLTIDRRSSVGPLRWFSYEDHTRIALELGEGLKYSATGRGVSAVELSVPLGVIEAPEQGRISDGIIESYALRQDAKLARLEVRLAKPGLSWKVRELQSPRRLALDVELLGERTVEPERAEPPPKPAPAAVSAAEKPRILSAAPAMPAKRRIVVDAGHGGKDPGATGRSGALEKDINLAAALQLARLLREEGHFEVMLTRDDDTFVPLADRSRLADEFGADLFVSLHCNASPDKKESGFEVYFLSETATDPEAQRLAERENAVLELEGKSPQDEQASAILQAMGRTEDINASSELASLVSRSLGRRVDLLDRGVKQAGFYVLRGTHAPAILFEMAFVSNRQDEAKLGSKKVRRKIVEGVYAGVLDFAKRRGWAVR